MKSKIASVLIVIAGIISLIAVALVGFELLILIWFGRTLVLNHILLMKLVWTLVAAMIFEYCISIYNNAIKSVKE